MTRKLICCAETDYASVPGGGPPTCRLGHGWSTGCMEKNDCPDYKVKMPTCKYCGSRIAIDNKFYDIETCVKCHNAGRDRRKR